MQEEPDPPDRRTASPRVCGWTSCGSGKPARSQRPTHKYGTYLRRRRTTGRSEACRECSQQREGGTYRRRGRGHAPAPGGSAAEPGTKTVGNRTCSSACLCSCLLQSAPSAAACAASACAGRHARTQTHADTRRHTGTHRGKGLEGPEGPAARSAVSAAYLRLFSAWWEQIWQMKGGVWGPTG